MSPRFAVKSPRRFWKSAVYCGGQTRESAALPVTPAKLLRPPAATGSSGWSQPSPWGFLGAHPGRRTCRAAAPPRAPRRSCTPWKAEGRRQSDPKSAPAARGSSCGTHRYAELRLESLLRLSWRVRFMDGGRFPGVSMNWAKQEEKQGQGKAQAFPAVILGVLCPCRCILRWLIPA